jgi:esterase/lipase superfamily enzyme
MFEASCRKDFRSSTEFSDKLLVGDLPSNQKVFVAVHGYKSEYSKTLIAYKTIETNLQRKRPEFDAMVGFFWPGSWSYSIGYIAADRRAPQASSYLVQLVRMLHQRGNTVVLEAHSLGNKVMLEALMHIPPGTIQEYIMAAPAVDNGVLTGKYATHIDGHKGKLMYSRRDSVLKWSYRLVPYNWTSPALGYDGPATKPVPNVELIDMTPFIDGHSAYRDADEFYKLI